MSAPWHSGSKHSSWLAGMPRPTSEAIEAIADRFSIGGTEGLENPHIWQVPEVVAAGGLRALAVAGEPKLDPERNQGEDVRGVIGEAFAAEPLVPAQPTRPGWRWHRLTDVARLATGHTPSRRHPEYRGGDIPWLQLPDIRALDGKVATETSQQPSNSKGWRIRLLSCSRLALYAYREQRRLVLSP